MATFRATELATGDVTEYEAELPQAQHLGAGWRLEQVFLVEPSPDEPVVPSTVYGGRRLLSRLEFLRLFTVTERITMRAAAKQSPVMEDYLQLLDLALEISLDDPDTMAGVQMMEGAGLLELGRAAEVLRG